MHLEKGELLEISICSVKSKQFVICSENGADIFDVDNEAITMTRNLMLPRMIIRKMIMINRLVWMIRLI